MPLYDVQRLLHSIDAQNHTPYAKYRMTIHDLPHEYKDQNLHNVTKLAIL